MEATAARTRTRRAAGVAAALGGVAIVAALVYLPVWLHRNEPPPPMATSARHSASDAVVAEVPDATLVGRHNGRRLWKFHARRILAAADGKTTTFEGIRDGILFEADQPAARVSAGKAVYDAAARSVTVTDGLKLESSGFMLRSQRMLWSSDSDIVDLPEPVTLSWNGGVASASTLRADTRLREITGRGVRMAARLEGPMFEALVKKMASGAALAALLASAASAEAPPGYKQVDVQGDVWRYSQPTRTHIYEGHIVATHGDTTLRADRIAYNEKTNTAVVTGNITVDNPRNHVEGDSAAVDFNTKVIRLKSDTSVKLVALPAKDGVADAGLRGRVKEPVTLTCPAITYNYSAKRADLTGPVKVVRKEQVLTGDSGMYLGQDELVTLTGNVTGRDEKGQTFTAPSLKASLQKDAEWLEAPKVKATFYVKDEDADAQPPKEPPSK